MLEAFDIVSHSRKTNESGYQPVELGEILAYLEIAKIDSAEDRVLFMNTVKTLDVAYLKHCAERQTR